MFVCNSRSPSHHHLCHHRSTSARTQIQRQRLWATRARRAQPHSDHLTDHRWGSILFLHLVTLNSVERIWTHFVCSLNVLLQLLTHQPNLLLTRSGRRPSESAGPDLRLLSQVERNPEVEDAFVSACVGMRPHACACRLPGRVHSVRGGQQHWADAPKLGKLCDPGGPSSWSTVQHHHLRRGGPPGERAGFCSGHHSWFSETR